jgi:hypothetical protein
MTTEPVLCACGEDTDFRADGLAIDDGKDAEGQQVFCLRCFVATPEPPPTASTLALRYQ